MNRTDRLLAILLELQRRRVTRAEDLAALFETSKRTIYRDVQALSESGVPVFGSPGQGYSLMEGYFLPPVSFTAEEAVVLMLGSDFIRQAFDSAYAEQAGHALRKIEAVLPEQVRLEADRARATMRLLAEDHLERRGKREKAWLGLLRGAILTERKVNMTYTGNHPDAAGNRRHERVVRPYGLVRAQGSWLLIAYCELRQDIRHFKLSRIDDLTIAEESYELPAQFRLTDYRPPDDRRILVRVRIRKELAAKVLEANSFYFERLEEDPQGTVAVFRVRDPRDVLPLLLGWGAGAEVLEPDSARNLIRGEIRRMAEAYGTLLT